MPNNENNIIQALLEDFQRYVYIILLSLQQFFMKFKFDSYLKHKHWY